MPNGEYFLVENRFNSGFDVELKHHSRREKDRMGAALWHIDESGILGVDDSGKLVIDYRTPSFPGDGKWPAVHYKIALVQADGLFQLEQSQNRGESKDLFRKNPIFTKSAYKITPKGLLFNNDTFIPGGANTNSYAYGYEQCTGISIEFGPAGSTMDMIVTFDDDACPPGSFPEVVTPEPTPEPTRSPTPYPTPRKLSVVTSVSCCALFCVECLAHLFAVCLYTQNRLLPLRKYQRLCQRLLLPQNQRQILPEHQRRKKLSASRTLANQKRQSHLRICPFANTIAQTTTESRIESIVVAHEEACNESNADGCGRRLLAHRGRSAGQGRNGDSRECPSLMTKTNRTRTPSWHVT